MEVKAHTKHEQVLSDVAEQLTCRTPGWFTCAVMSAQLVPKARETEALGCCVVMLLSVFNVPDLHTPQGSSQPRKHTPFCSFHFLRLLHLLAKGPHSASSSLSPFLILCSLDASPLQYPEDISSMAVFLPSLLTASKLLITLT